MMTALYVLGAWVYLCVWFFAVARYLAMRDEGTWEEIPAVIRYSVQAGLVPGLALDAMFNVTYGTIAFREPPQEFLFTKRVKRHVKDPGVSRRKALAKKWKGILNAIDPGHV